MNVKKSPKNALRKAKEVLNHSQNPLTTFLKPPPHTLKLKYKPPRFHDKS